MDSNDSWHTTTSELPAVAESTSTGEVHSAARLCARQSASCCITITVQDHEFANIFAQEASHKDYLEDVLSFKVPAVDESVTKNNVIRSSTIEEMAKIKPVKPHDTITAANASAANASASAANASVSAANASVSAANASASAANASALLGDVQSALDRSTSAFMQSSQALLATRSHMDELSTEVANLRLQLGDVQSALDGNTSAIMQSSQDLLATRSHVDELSTEVAELSTEVAKLKSQSTSYKVKTGIAFVAGAVIAMGGLWLLGR